MVATYNCVQGDGVAGKSEGVECGVYEAGVGTACEEDEAFVCRKLSVEVLEVRVCMAVFMTSMSSKCTNA